MRYALAAIHGGWLQVLWLSWSAPLRRPPFILDSGGCWMAGWRGGATSWLYWCLLSWPSGSSASRNEQRHGCMIRRPLAGWKKLLYSRKSGQLNECYPCSFPDSPNLHTCAGRTQHWASRSWIAQFLACLDVCGTGWQGGMSRVS